MLAIARGERDCNRHFISPLTLAFSGAASLKNLAYDSISSAMSSFLHERRMTRSCYTLPASVLPSVRKLYNFVLKGLKELLTLGFHNVVCE